jgi:hypothetical protein
MGQGLTGSSGTYARLKDILTRPIPAPNPEPALSQAMLGRSAFEHFVDDDGGGADTMQNLIEFLHTHYFPRLAWARLRLNPAKAKFGSANVRILRHMRAMGGVRPSADKMKAFRDWLTPTEPKELERFLAALPFLKMYILGRADLMSRLKTASQTEPGIMRTKKGKAVNRKIPVALNWTPKHDMIFQTLKDAVCNNCVIAGNDIQKNSCHK